MIACVGTRALIPGLSHNAAGGPGIDSLRAGLCPGWPAANAPAGGTGVARAIHRLSILQDNPGGAGGRVGIFRVCRRQG